jgi:predicted RNase H-like HicB family nuclease
MKEQIAAIESAPDHKVHVVWRSRVDTWRDEDTGAYIASIPESITQGETEASAIESAKSVLKVHAELTLAASQGKDWPDKG